MLMLFWYSTVDNLFALKFRDGISISHQKNRIVAVKWMSDGAVDMNSELLVPIKRAVEIHVPQGLSGSAGMNSLLKKNPEQIAI